MKLKTNSGIMKSLKKSTVYYCPILKKGESQGLRKKIQAILSNWIYTAPLLDVFRGVETLGEENEKNLSVQVGPPATSFAGGTGSEGDPYQINTVTHLQEMEFNRSAHYKLITNIDASATATWNGSGSSYKGFKPVGNNTVEFTGSFDGKGYTISGLFINRSSINYVGLFGKTAASARITDVDLRAINITGGGLWTGGLVGWNSGCDGATGSFADFE